MSGGAGSNGSKPGVLHVVATGLRRGAEIFASDLIAALNDAGVPQRVFVLHGSEPLPLAYGAPIALPPPTRLPGLPGVRVEPRTVLALRRLVAAEAPDVLHAHGGEALKYALAATGRRGPRVLYRRIALADPGVRTGLRRTAHAALMRRAHRIVAVAEAVRRETIDVFGVPMDRVLTVPRGVDGRRVDPVRGREETRHALGIPQDAAVILSMAAFHWDKDPVAHVEVAARVLRRREDAVHLVAGDGDLRPEVEAAVQRHGLEGRIRLLGNRPDVGDLLAASDVMILASRNEGMPGCLIEAGMAGLPVAAYALAGTPEVVLDGTTGFLAPAGDVDALADRVAALLADETLRAEMGAAARTHCRAVFDIASVAPRYLDLYRELAQ